MHHNPYHTTSRRNPWLIIAWLFLVAGLYGVCMQKAQAAPLSDDENASEMVSQAWLVHHGIETSQWKDQACKERALELVDEDKLTQARLDEAMQLALHADTVECTKKGIQHGDAGMATTLAGSLRDYDRDAVIQNTQAQYNAATWQDETCRAVAFELADIAPGEVASQERIDAAKELVDRASTARNCRIEGEQLVVDVGSFSDAPNACHSTLILDPTKSPYIKRVCPFKN